MEIKIPELSLVLLLGASGAGKSTFAARHFLATETISSDFCRAIVSDDENSLEATQDAFELLRTIVAKRLKRGKLTVVDATNVEEKSRQGMLALAKKYHVHPVAIVFNIKENICQQRNKERKNRNVRAGVIRSQRQQLLRSIKKLKHQGFRFIFCLDTPQKVDQVSIVRQPLWNNRQNEHGPFDIIGDIHGCIDELHALLKKLGYQIEKNTITPPLGRKAIFVGDLVDRGPNSPGVLKLVMDMVDAEIAVCVPGNHDIKLLRKLNGRDVQIKHGLAETLAQLEQHKPEFLEKVKKFLNSLVSHYVLDSGKLIVAHAGLKEDMHGRGSKAVREFCLYGETTGETDEFGLPVRYNWASEYKGKSMIVYGHTPIPTPEWLNNTINIDTGCVFGGKLTALRYPERELIMVDALKQYSKPIKPIAPINTELNMQQQFDDLLNIEDYVGKWVISTKLRKNITIREENSIAALEVMSRFGVNPKWLIYLPPTMSPCATSKKEEYLEYPQEAFHYYSKNKVKKVVCEEKHMGSRAVVIVCKDKKTVQKRFGIEEDTIGICYTRTGRNFFESEKIAREFLQRLQNALDSSNFWKKHQTDWVCLDCELMPWSHKAQALLINQYAAVGTAAITATSEVTKALEMAKNRGVNIGNSLEHYQRRQQMLDLYTKAYQRYCWPVNSVNDLQLAPFHILATEAKVYSDKNHKWHMQEIAEICKVDSEFLVSTQCLFIDMEDKENWEHAAKWWESLTAKGGEGMVIKPMEFISYNNKKLLQPAVKCRGQEYLRIIYGPEYTLAENMKKLQKRLLGPKQSLALREFSLGLEALEHFVKREPLRKIHQCVFAILALESEPVDPRL